MNNNKITKECEKCKHFINGACYKLCACLGVEEQYDYADLGDYSKIADHSHIDDYSEIADYSKIADYRKIADFSDMADYRNISINSKNQSNTYDCGENTVDGMYFGGK